MPKTTTPFATLVLAVVFLLPASHLPAQSPDGNGLLKLDYAYTHVTPENDTLDLGSLHFVKEPDEPFTGKVGKISLSIPIPKEVGEYVVEIRRLEILQ
ncbi:MAG: hypothetical protein WC003_00500 [Terrimicrobiaceae bacterium]